jgi:hypothetical protein
MGAFIRRTLQGSKENVGVGGPHLDTVLDKGVMKVELVALRRVAPRSAAQ